MSGPTLLAERRPGILRRWLARARTLRAEAKGFDLAWARWALTVMILGPLSGVFAAYSNLLWLTEVVNGVFGLMLCLYFGHILVRRLQCSILEVLVLVALLGNLAGLVVTMPGMTRSPELAVPLLMLMMAWGLYAAVIALAQARLLDVNGYASRGLLLLIGWLASASPVLLGGAGVLWYLQDAQHGMLVSEHMASLIVPLAAFGAFGLIARCVLGLKAVRAAKRILA